MIVEVWNRKESETAELLREVEPALSVERVSHAYGARLALDDVSFTVPCGSFTVLLGLNGAGKSTLFSLITRLYDIRDGYDPHLRPRVSASPARRCAGSAWCSRRAPSISI